ncbi:MAG: hypothetical protein KDK66_08815 [Deltaproteobacteria bacterium]|nr:hypothetical protein [Deltaproteobacteria bacterium]
MSVSFSQVRQAAGLKPLEGQVLEQKPRTRQTGRVELFSDGYQLNNPSADLRAALSGAPSAARQREIASKRLEANEAAKNEFREGLARDFNAASKEKPNQKAPKAEVKNTLDFLSKGGADKKLYKAYQVAQNAVNGIGKEVSPKDLKKLETTKDDGRRGKLATKAYVSLGAQREKAGRLITNFLLEAEKAGVPQGEARAVARTLHRQAEAKHHSSHQEVEVAANTIPNQRRQTEVLELARADKRGQLTPGQAKIQKEVLELASA